MSSSTHDTESAAALQGVSWNEEDWQGMLKRLPSNWQEQAVKLKAWQRVRKLAQVTDLLRALLVYAACGYSFRQLGLWATLMGVGRLALGSPDWVASVTGLVAQDQRTHPVAGCQSSQGSSRKRRRRAHALRL